MISLKTWFAGGVCMVDPRWETGHVFSRQEHVKQSRGSRYDMMYFNKLFMAHSLFEEREAEILDGWLLKDGLNEGEARKIIRHNEASWRLEKQWNDKIKVNDYTLFEDKFGYDLGFLK